MKNIFIQNKSLWKYDNSKYHVQTSESWLHTDLYLNTDTIVSNPKFLSQIVKEVFIEEIKKRELEIDWIITYPPFGLPIGYELASQIGAKFWYVDTIRWTCDFDMQIWEKVLVVADDIYSGWSIKKTIQIIKDKWIEVIWPMFSIGNFSSTQEVAWLKVVSALSETGNLYEAKDCPMCEIWSEALLPRPNWEKIVGK